MSKPNDGGPAFPLTTRGLSLRQYYKAKAMQGLIASRDEDGMVIRGASGTNAVEIYESWRHMESGNPSIAVLAGIFADNMISEDDEFAARGPDYKAPLHAIKDAEDVSIISKDEKIVELVEMVRRSDEIITMLRDHIGHYQDHIATMRSRLQAAGLKHDDIPDTRVIHSMMSPFKVDEKGSES